MANILIADDSASMRSLISSSLQSAGHRVTAVNDGKQALNTAKLNAFDAVITDVNMPALSGLELTRALRALPAYKYTPILMLTTESAGDVKAEGRAAGATGWLIKPFNPDKLLATVKQVLG